MTYDGSSMPLLTEKFFEMLKEQMLQVPTLSGEQQTKIQNIEAQAS